MEYRPCGQSGLKVSSLALGTMTWGRDTEEEDAIDQLADFAEAGGTLIDTAASYGDGAAEELLGRLLGEIVDRDELIIATKSGVRLLQGTSIPDASRGNLLTTLEGSLRRLGTDHVDLWIVQTPDQSTGLDETLGTLARAVEAGKARYVGLSNHPAWACAYAAAQLAALGIELAAVEMEYSLLERSIEQEVVPAALALGFGILAWSPLGRGVLTGKYRHSIPADSRAASAHLRGFVEPYLNARAGAIVEALAAAGVGLGRPGLEVALAWARDQAGVTSVIAGARTAAQLRAALATSDTPLPEEIVDALREVSAREGA